MELTLEQARERARQLEERVRELNRLMREATDDGLRIRLADEPRYHTTKPGTQESAPQLRLEVDLVLEGRVDASSEL